MLRTCILILILRWSTADNASVELHFPSLCEGSRLVPPASDWIWSTAPNPSPSCTAPAARNVGQMCQGDPTSVAMQSLGQTGCFSTAMPDCKFSMRQLDQMDFDLAMANCGGTWAAPLWMTPNFWGGGARSGEIDMVELCPTPQVMTNFAGATPPIGYPARWSVADPNGFSGHVTLWRQVAADGRHGVTVKLCEKREAEENGGSCLGANAAFYPDIFGSVGCTSGHDCVYSLVSDIWNGVSGDAGFAGCRGGAGPSSRNCGFSIQHIRISGPSFIGKCAALASHQRPVVASGLFENVSSQDNLELLII